MCVRTWQGFLRFLEVYICTLKAGFHMWGKSQTIRDFTASHLSQILQTNENLKYYCRHPQSSGMVGDKSGKLGVLFPTRARFLWWSMIIQDNYMKTPIFTGNSFRSLPFLKFFGSSRPPPPPPTVSHKLKSLWHVSLSIKIPLSHILPEYWQNLGRSGNS